MTATELAGNIASGLVNPIEAGPCYLERIEAREPSLTIAAEWGLGVQLGDQTHAVCRRPEGSSPFAAVREHRCFAPG